MRDDQLNNISVAKAKRIGSDKITPSDIIDEARSWIGTPYLHQGSLKNTGCDCLGLIRGVWRALYLDEPETAPAYTSDWAECDNSEPMLGAAKRHFIELEDQQAGALLLFRWAENKTIKHAGIYTGNGRFIHAYERAGVIETYLGSSWQNRLAACFAFPTSYPKTL